MAQWQQPTGGETDVHSSVLSPLTTNHARKSAPKKLRVVIRLQIQ